LSVNDISFSRKIPIDAAKKMIEILPKKMGESMDDAIIWFTFFRGIKATPKEVQQILDISKQFGFKPDASKLYKKFTTSETFGKGAIQYLLAFLRDKGEMPNQLCENICKRYEELLGKSRER
jgi:hypothetical protein